MTWIWFLIYAASVVVAYRIVAAGTRRKRQWIDDLVRPLRDENTGQEWDHDHLFDHTFDKRFDEAMEAWIADLGYDDE